MKKYLLILFAFIFFSCEKEDNNVSQNISSAQKHFVTIDQIKQIVAGKKFNGFISKFDNNQISKGNLSKESELTVVDFVEYKDKEQLTAFYMTKLSNDKFVLFAADDRSHTVMAVTDTGEPLATISGIPEEFRYWLDEEIEAIEFARENYIAQTDEIEKEWLSYKLPPPPPPPTECTMAFNNTKWPLLTTNWGQWDGYNNYAPHLGCASGNGNAPSGCVATETAQIMKYHQWPSSYNWNAMPNNWGTNATSQLMIDIGNNVSMDYACDGSGTKTYRAMYALKGTFGYSSAYFGDYNYNTVLSELSQNKPVLLAGGEKKYWAGLIPYYAEGHAWVADGYMHGYECFYDENGYVNGGYGYLLFHMNWGWGNYGVNHNMWCGLNNFTAANGNSFNYKRKMIYGIRK